MLTILIVDDEYWVRYGLKVSIDWEKHGFRIADEASDGEEALKLAIKLKPDIIITDIKMPFMSGVEFMRLLRNNKIESKIIVLSGYDDFQYAKSAIDYGASAYVLKPIQNENLIKTLNKVADVIKKESMTDCIVRNKLLNDFINLLKQERNFKANTANAQTKEAMEYIKSHYNEDIELNTLANALYISEYYLCHIFKEITGITVRDYITEYRIKKAKQFLRDKKYKVYEVGMMVGYNDSRYFSQVFKRITGMTPKEYSVNSIYER